jgi:hypothetical protein
MKSRLARPAFSSLEVLEQRIAPALLIAGANLLGGSNPHTGETSVGDHSAEIVKVISGQALVWFDGRVVTGISFAPNTRLEIHGDVFGDVVGNLTAAGRLSDSDGNPLNGEDGGVLLANDLSGLATFALAGGQKGSVGNIITGGSVANVSISDELHGIFAGDAVFHTDSHALTGLNQVLISVGVDVNPVEPGFTEEYTLTKVTDPALINASMKAGASINNVSVGTANELQIFAGNGHVLGSTVGGAGHAGGSVNKVKIVSAFSNSGSLIRSYDIRGGDGADGAARGGAGGAVFNVVEQGSSGLAAITGGKGGAGTNGPGGAGGSVINLDLQSDSTGYTVTGGGGGAGKGGGAGGSLLNNNFSGSIPTTGIIVSADFTGDGADDVLVVDGGTGQMVISENNGTGSSFQLLEQYVNNNFDSVYLITGAGTTPVDAKAVDIDSDGDLDIVVAYRNSDSLGIYLNQGAGVFYTSGDFSTVTADLGFTPSKIAVGQFGGDSTQDIAVLENTLKTSALHLVTGGLGTGGELSLTVAQGYTSFDARQAADLVAVSNGAGNLYVGFTTGGLSNLRATFGSNAPFVEIQTGVTIASGVANLDVDTVGNQLLALSNNGKTLNVYDIQASGGLNFVGSPDLSGEAGKPIVAHFVRGSGDSNFASLAVLSALSSGAQIEIFDALDAVPGDPASAFSYTLSKTVISTGSLKNFVPTYSHETPGLAALGGSLNRFVHSASFNDLQKFALPFVGKNAGASAGDGGLGLGASKGGAGGSIRGLNADATALTLTAGDGGDTESGIGGDGGYIRNLATLTTSGGKVLVPRLVADSVLLVNAGDGGSFANLASSNVKGGNGGTVQALSLSLNSGEILLASGDGGDGRGRSGGNAGNIVRVSTESLDGDLTVTTGHGGAASSGATSVGGSGGSLSGFSHVQKLADNVEKLEGGYLVSIHTGAGGSSQEGAGGAGGAISGLKLNLDAANSGSANFDSTTAVQIGTGGGGDGKTRGGAGGGLSGFTAECVYDNTITVNFFTLDVTTGVGGDASTGVAGNGGAVSKATLSGFSSPDTDAFTTPAEFLSAFESSMKITAGDGGHGGTRGGLGGSIDLITAQNSPVTNNSVLAATMLGAANFTAGSGGDADFGNGGAGGSLSRILAGTKLGALAVQAGAGGDGGVGSGATTGLGGAGGSIVRSSLGVVVSITGEGVLAFGGNGGAGITGGGAGGSLLSLNLNTYETMSGIAGFLHAGSGGDAGGSGAHGGAGGRIDGITQSKDLNSSISAIIAGAGGDAPSGTGGLGGSVTNVKTIGFIGKPSDLSGKLGIFDEAGRVQGVFAGAGGTGATVGLAGSVLQIHARQIAAIATIVDEGTNTFGLAKRVAGISADRVGYDVDGDLTFDAGTDGFIRAQLINVSTAIAPFQFTV